MRIVVLSLLYRGVAATALMLSTLSAAGGASITWGPPRVTTGALADISATGTLVLAWTANNTAAPFTLDPGGLAIPFVLGPGLGEPSIDFDPFTWPHPDYDKMIAKGHWSVGDTTLQLPGLSPSKTYQIQLWVSDTRDCCGAPTRVKTYGDGNGNTVTLYNGNNSGGSGNVIGTFVADGPTQTLAFIGSGDAHPIYNAIIVRDISADTDHDGIIDVYEDANGLDKNLDDAGSDLDNDGLTNKQEFNFGTRANLPDTDGDGLSDKVETKTGTYVSPTNTGTNPLKEDTDADGLNDASETNTGVFLNAANAGTNPFSVDSDADGFKDGLETLYSNANPVNAGSKPLRAGLLDLLAYFPFDDASNPTQTLDTVKGFVGVLQASTVFTPNGGGRTGVGNDRAIDMGGAAQVDTGVRVAAAAFLDIGAAQDEIAVSFWQRLSSTPASSSFWGAAPSVGGRGINGHAPWTDGNFHWDTAGCCDGGTQRVSGPVGTDLVTPAAWHHLVFQKKGAIKEVWLDGALVVSGNNTSPLPNDFTVLHIASDAGNANIAGRMDDFAVFGDALTPAQVAALAGGASPPSLVPPNTDADGDGMPNGYETANGLDPEVDDRAGDLDNDGSSNFAEFLKNTFPNNPDSDGDSLKDGAETKTGIYVSATDTGTDPLTDDTDDDGFSDRVETNTLVFVSPTNPGTNPNETDTDGDTWTDRTEIHFGSDPTRASSVPTLNPGLDILAWWTFDDATRPTLSTDVVHSVVANLVNGAVLTQDSLGRTGAAGDRALDLGLAQGAQAARVIDAQWLNLAVRPLFTPNLGSLGTAADLLVGYAALDTPGALAGSPHPAITFAGNFDTKAAFSPALNPAAAFTAEGWFKPAAQNDAGILTSALASGHFAAPRSGWVLYQSDLGWNFRTYTGVGTATAVNITAGAPPVANSWYHVVATWDGTVGRLYVNGVLGATSPAVTYLPAVDGDLHIGSRSDSSDQTFAWKGSADEVALYSSALSAATIAAHYANGTNPARAMPYEQLVGASIPTAYWRMTNPTPGAATRRDEIAISFWQKLRQVSNSSAFWAISPSSNERRGIQGHAPLSNGTLAFDTAGCCDDATQRIFGPAGANLAGDWHHFVFQKKGPQKEIWVDGVRKINGLNNASIPSDLTRLYIGSAIEGGSTVGLIDDFVVFANFLNQDQISKLSAGQPPSVLPGPPPQLAITSAIVNAAARTIQLTWNSQAGATYAVEASTTMTSGSWVVVNPNVPSLGPSTLFTYNVNTFPPGGAMPAALYLRVKKL